MELDNIKQRTTWNDASASINSNFMKVRQAILALQSEGGGLDEAELEEYLTSQGYTKEEWVLAQNALLEERIENLEQEGGAVNVEGSEFVDVKDGEISIIIDPQGGLGATEQGLGIVDIPSHLLEGIKIDVDSSMSDTSENAVANKVIKKYVDQRAEQAYEQANEYTDEEIAGLREELQNGIDHPVFEFEFDSATNKATAEMVAALAEAIAADKLILCNGRTYKFILEQDGMYGLVSDTYLDIMDGKLKASVLAVMSSSYDVQLAEEEVPVGTEITEETVRGWGFTKNAGTITGIKMNGATKGTSGVVDLGTVITAHQQLKTINNQSIVGSGNITIQGGGATPRVEMTAASAAIEPNKFYVWPMMDSLDLTLGTEQSGVMNRYLFQFRNPKAGLTMLTLPDDITWSEDTELDENGLPVMEAAAFYRIEIIEGLASLKKWKLVYINFADAEVERVLMSKGIGDGIGITKRDAAAVTEFAGDLLKNNTTAASFSEIRYFKGLKKIYGGAFYKATNLVIEELDNPSLTAIGYGAFNSTKLRKIVGLGENVTIQSASAGLGGAFQNCSELTQLSEEAGRSIVFVGASAFVGTALQGVLDLSNAVTIESSTFRELQGVTRIILGYKCKTIGNGAFYKNVNAVIDDLNLAGLISLGGGAFNSTKMRKITSLGSVTSMPVNGSLTGGVFENCTELTEIAQEVLDKLTYIATAWEGCSNLRIDLILPNLTGTITHGFAKCPIQRILDLGAITNLFSDASLAWNTLPFGSEYTLMILPSTLERIGRYAFAGDSKMEALVIKAVTPPFLAAYAFNESKATCPVYVPDESVSAYQTAAGWTAWASRIRGIGQLATDNPTLYAEIQQYL